MSRSVIQVENLAKLYRLGEVGTGTLSHDFNRWLAKVRGKEDPFQKIGSVNDRTKKAESNYSWALRDVNFNVTEGDVLGIIGKNGAGKSTLLKLLSRITSPSTGSIKVKGRIASLLEVGTGFHPELTGRENIFLNGAILGMTKSEIKKKFDDIVDFAGVERYIDTPVKRYSSGMYVRLAFAVAANLESEILIVDEVLAVGDAEFQKKCLGKMSDISHKEGRTVLFVSHNIGSLLQLCNKGLLLKNGTVDSWGTIANVAENYIKQDESSTTQIKVTNSNKEIFFEEIYITYNDKKVSEIPHDASATVFMKVRLNSTHIKKFNLGISLLDQFKRKVFTSHFLINTQDKNYCIVKCTLPANIISPGFYSIDVAAFIHNVTTFEYHSDICPFNIIDFGTELAYSSGENGCLLADCNWNYESLNS